MIHLVKTLLPYLKPYRRRALTAVLLAFPLAAIKTYQAYLVKPIFDRGLSSHSTFDDALMLALLLMGLAMINVPIRYFHFYWMRFVVDRASCDIREKVYLKLQRVPVKYFQDHKQGDMIAKIISDSQTLAMGFHGSVDLIREPLVGVAMLALALYRDWQLTLVILFTFPLFYIIFIKTGRKVKAHQVKVQEHIADMTHNVGEGVSGQKIAKAFNLQQYMVDRFRRAQELYFRYQMKANKVEELASPLVEFVGAMAFAGVIVFAHHRITTGAMTTGDFISFITALALLMDPIRKFSRGNIKVNQAAAAGDRIFELLSLKEEKDEGVETLTRFQDKIEIDSVSFAFDENKVFKDFSLTIHKGEKVALVGFSGSGKSTLINLLLRLYHCQQGSIRIDGIPIEKLTLTSLRSLFALVSQDIFLFNDSIEENLLLGHPERRPAMEKALEVAYARSFVAELPQQESTVIGDRGTKLSGGQSQRLTIARAFLQNAPILLFDEATSALDNESEKIVQEALERLAEDKTVITVAHRLSTIKDYDKIVVLDRGRIVEVGKHQELLEQQGEYFRFYHSH